MTKEVELNVKEAVLAPIIHLMQGDSGIEIRCRIMSGTDEYRVDAGAFDLVVLSGVTSKGNMVSLPVKGLSGNLVEFELTQNETDVAGDIRACVEFSGREGTKPRKLSTYPFIIKVTENPSYTAVGQKDNVKSLEDYVEQVKGYADVAGDASEVIQNAKREIGECVSAAQGFSESAESHAGNAGEQAANASGSAESASRDAQEIKERIAVAQNCADSAGVSAQTAAQKAEAAEACASSAAESSENARKYEEQAKLISESFSGALRPMGTVAFADIPVLSDAAAGDMYNISDQFTTSSLFKEGEGNVVPAGANIYKTSDGFWDVLAGSPVTSVNGQRGNVRVSPGDIGAFPISSDETRGDFNDMTTPGVYMMFSNKNAPTAYQFWSLTVTKSQANKISQIAISNYGRDFFIRSGDGTGYWQDWEKTLMVSSVANNLVTTNVGYALDARQGKALMDEITGINNNFSQLSACDLLATTSSADGAFVALSVVTKYRYLYFDCCGYDNLYADKFMPTYVILCGHFHHLLVRNTETGNQFMIAATGGSGITIYPTLVNSGSYVTTHLWGVSRI